MYEPKVEWLAICPRTPFHRWTNLFTSTLVFSFCFLRGTLCGWMMYSVKVAGRKWTTLCGLYVCNIKDFIIL